MNEAQTQAFLHFIRLMVDVAPHLTHSKQYATLVCAFQEEIATASPDAFVPQKLETGDEEATKIANALNDLVAERVSIEAQRDKLREQVRDLRKHAKALKNACDRVFN